MFSRQCRYPQILSVRQSRNALIHLDTDQGTYDVHRVRLEKQMLPGIIMVLMCCLFLLWSVALLLAMWGYVWWAMIWVVFIHVAFAQAKDEIVKRRFSVLVRCAAIDNCETILAEGHQDMYEKLNSMMIAQGKKIWQAYRAEL